MINITNIERFATHDGPGIRTTLFLKGCPLYCPWCANPETQSVKRTMFHNAMRCVACRACEQVCPHQAITFQQGVFTYQEARCQRCGACERACLQDAIAFQGIEMELEAIMEELCKDRDYYENSGGGITFSGGEPFVQQDALWKLLHACKQEGFHTAVETTGNYASDLLIRMMPLIDLFLFDFKHPDDAVLHTVTGADGALIKENLRYLLKVNPQKVIVRIPVIPDFNYDKATLEHALRYLKSIGVCEVHLLPYHTLGKVKYEKMGKPYTLSKSMLQKEELAYYRDYAEKLGMQANIGG